MQYKVFNVDELVNTKDADREIADLMENNGAHLKLIALKKHQDIEPHMSHTDVGIYVIDGELEFAFSTSGDSNCTCQACGCSVEEHEKDDMEKFKVKKEQLFFFGKDIMHSVTALKDSSFLVIKI